MEFYYFKKSKITANAIILRQTICKGPETVSVYHAKLFPIIHKYMYLLITICRKVVVRLINETDRNFDCLVMVSCLGIKQQEICNRNKWSNETQKHGVTELKNFWWHQI